MVSDQDHEIGETARNEELGADCLLVEGTVDLALEVPGPCLSEPSAVSGWWMMVFNYEKLSSLHCRGQGAGEMARVLPPLALPAEFGRG